MMIEVAIMIEGQNGLTWTKWKKIAKTVEGAGFTGLYRSDHYTNSQPPDKNSLELWTSLTWLASHTNRIEFGPLVSPVSFRDPSMTARMAAAVDDLSGSRLTLGLGAGWQEREHTLFGWDLLDLNQRFNRFEEGLEIITRLLHNDQPSTFSGDFFKLRGGILLPRPTRPQGPPILIGGNGPLRTLPLVARFADEWNALMIPLSKYKELNARLTTLLKQENRESNEVRRSLMVGCIFGKDQKDVTKKVQARSGGKSTVEAYREKGVIVGTSEEIIEQIIQLAEAGLQRVMLQWLDLDDMQGLEDLAEGILPYL